jgi:predicted PurR-regulated permease PerM
MIDSTVRTTVRVVASAVFTLLAFALIWEVRGPLVWVLIAALLATALSAPVNRLSTKMPRALAIVLVYLVLVMVPIGLLLAAVPPLVREATKFINNLPDLVQQLQHHLESNPRLASVMKDFDPLKELQKQADQVPKRVGDVANLLAEIGLGALNSILATVTIVILSVFFVSSGGRWIRGGIELFGRERRELWHRLADHTGTAVAAYFVGSLIIALVAGITSGIVMTILGIPYPMTLAVFCGVASLIPMFGATIAAVIVGIIAALTTSWAVVIGWTIWEIVYQQVENNLIQPQIQKRTVSVPPVLTVLGVLFGSSLLGVLGAIVAVPLIAAAIGIYSEISAWNRGGAAMREDTDWATLEKKRENERALDLLDE